MACVAEGHRLISLMASRPHVNMGMPVPGALAENKTRQLSLAG